MNFMKSHQTTWFNTDPDPPSRTSRTRVGVICDEGRRSFVRSADGLGTPRAGTNTSIEAQLSSIPHLCAQRNT